MEFELDELNDPDIDGQLQAQILEYQNAIGSLKSELMFPAPLRAAVGLGGIAAAYTGNAIPAILAGIVGWKLGNKTPLTDGQKMSISQKIEHLQNELDRLQAGERSAEATISGIMSSYDLAQYSYENYPFDGSFQELMGQPSVPFSAMVFGKPKNGKSIFCTQMAKYVSENFGPTLYVAAEEGFSYTLQKKLNEFGLSNQNLHFSNVRDFEGIKELLDNQPFLFVFIDSVNFMKITPEQIEELKALNPSTSFITVQQATKDGKFRGSQEYAHNCDAVIEVIAGVAHHMGRFQDAGTTYEIFPQEEEQEAPAPKTKKAPVLDAQVYQSEIDF
jgi:hypothetical protein